MLYDRPRIRIMGDSAVLFELGEGVDPEVNERIRSLFRGAEKNLPPGILELVPSYGSLLIVYDPMTISLDEVEAAFYGFFDRISTDQDEASEIVRIPVVYGGKRGPDLEWVAGFHDMSGDEVIAAHASVVYRVYMIGFTPGFAYMGDLPDRIVTPRRDTPRTAVPTGSVAIAQKQTGVYPSPSPGGWQIIGWTPVRFFDPGKQPPAALRMGDRVRFYPVSGKEAADWTP